MQRNKSSLGLASPQFSMVMSPQKSSETVIKDDKLARLREKILPEWREIMREVRRSENNDLILKDEL